jgi:dolichol-phosphate mannosyltransferase
MIDLTLLLLTKNEEGNVKSVITRSKTQLDNLNLSYEIVVIDADSTDGTAEEAKVAGAHVIVQEKHGYGGALIEGIEFAKGVYILTLDVDGSHSPELIPQLWEARTKSSCVIASRFVKGGGSDAPLFRKLLSRLLSLTFPKLLSLPIADVSSGFRLYKKDILDTSKYKEENFSILLEILTYIYINGYQVAEIPLVYTPRKTGLSKASIFKFGIEFLSLLFRLWKIRNSIESADYDHRAYDSIIPLQRYWQRTRFKYVYSLLGNTECNILDIGCGTSRIVQGHPESVAMDYSFKKLRYLGRTNKKRIQASTFLLPFKDESFDKIIHSQVIEHIPHDPIIFTELSRVIRQDGILIIGTPDYGRIWWPIIEYFYDRILPNAYGHEHITHYTKKSLFKDLENVGFKVLDYKYILGGELIVKAHKS